MKLLSNFRLVKDINCFYKKFYEGSYTKLRIKDLQNRDWLAEIMHDIDEVLQSYDGFYEEAYEVYHFLNSINDRLIRRVLNENIIENNIISFSQLLHW